MTPEEKFRRLAAVPGAQVSLLGDELIWHGPGEMPDPETLPEPQPPAPTIITRAELHMWLHEHGVAWSDLVAWAEAQPEGIARDRLLILLKDAGTFDRRDPRIRAAALALPLGLTEDTVDAALEQAWREAAT